MSDEHTRKFQCEYYTVYARPNSCFFCDNCNDIFYDYRNGYASPYMWLCDKGNDTELGMMGKCQDFYEEAEQTENSSEKPNNCEYAENPSGDAWECGCFLDTYCEHQIYDRNPDGTINIVECGYEPKDEPQTETEVIRTIIHKMIDNTDIAEDAYPDLRQRLHDAVDEYEPNNSEKPNNCKECEHWNDTGDGCADRHGCKDEPQTDCAWR